LPPVKLYKLEEAYFVVDGHHRVSVARYHDVPTVEASVAEFRPKLPAAPLPTISNGEFRIAS
jgi:ParB-like chromosome segregation protein Spo0J